MSSHGLMALFASIFVTLISFCSLFSASTTGIRLSIENNFHPWLNWTKNISGLPPYTNGSILTMCRVSPVLVLKKCLSIRAFKSDAVTVNALRRGCPVAGVTVSLMSSLDNWILGFWTIVSFSSVVQENNTQGARSNRNTCLYISLGF